MEKIIQVKIKQTDIKNSLPKYSTQLINLANQNSQATRPKNVGQLSNLFPEFLKTNDSDYSLENWEKWYKNKMGDIFNSAESKIKNQLNSFKQALKLIDDEMINLWLNDLIINQTYAGMIIQYKIIQDIANSLNYNYRFSTKKEEGANIDGFINEKAVQIKAETFGSTDAITKVQNIKCQIITYKINEDNISYNFDPNYFK